MSEIVRVSRLVPESWCINAKKFLNDISYKGYFLAGNSVANMIEGIELKGDLDFWCKKSEDFIPTIDKFVSLLDVERYEVYPSLVDIYSKDMPKISLIYTE